MGAWAVAELIAHPSFFVGCSTFSGFAPEGRRVFHHEKEIDRGSNSCRPRFGGLSGFICYLMQHQNTSRDCEVFSYKGCAIATDRHWTRGNLCIYPGWQGVDPPEFRVETVAACLYWFATRFFCVSCAEDRLG